QDDAPQPRRPQRAERRPAALGACHRGGLRLRIAVRPASRWVHGERKATQAVDSAMSILDVSELPRTPPEDALQPPGARRGIFDGPRGPAGGDARAAARAGPRRGRARGLGGRLRIDEPGLVERRGEPLAARPAERYARDHAAAELAADVLGLLADLGE